MCLNRPLLELKKTSMSLRTSPQTGVAIPRIEVQPAFISAIFNRFAQQSTSSFLYSLFSFIFLRCPLWQSPRPSGLSDERGDCTSNRGIATSAAPPRNDSRIVVRHSPG